MVVGPPLPLRLGGAILTAGPPIAEDVEATPPSGVGVGCKPPGIGVAVEAFRGLVRGGPGVCVGVGVWVGVEFGFVLVEAAILVVKGWGGVVVGIWTPS